MPDLPRLFSEFPVSDVKLPADLRIPTLRLDEALSYASLRCIERPGRDPMRLPPGIGVVEIPFDGDIGVFDLIPENGVMGPPGETRGYYVRLYVPNVEDGRPDSSAVMKTIKETISRLLLLGGNSCGTGNLEV